MARSLPARSMATLSDCSATSRSAILRSSAARASVGSAGKATVTARDVKSTHDESLEITGLPAGNYVVEIARGNCNCASAAWMAVVACPSAMPFARLKLMVTAGNCP